MKTLLNRLLNHESLSQEDANILLTKITDGSATDSQIVAAITAMMMRNVTAEELNGFRKSLLSNALPLHLDGADAIDVCGTGGDQKDTFNISTLSAFVIAAAGYRVIKHGNYGVSSLCGSSTILQELGYVFTSDEERLQEELAENNICFLHAPLFHPCLKRVSQIRKELGVRTFFNFLGPLVNPAQPAYQLTGVYNLNVARLYADILREERSGYTIVHSVDGYDEVSLTGGYKIINTKEEGYYYPEDIGVNTVLPSDLFGGRDVAASVTLFKDILSGLGTQIQQEVVIVNAAYGIQCLRPHKDFQTCYSEAEVALRSGKALQKLKQGISISQRSVSAIMK